jgi:hypothetical protein
MGAVCEYSVWVQCMGTVYGYRVLTVRHQLYSHTVLTHVLSVERGYRYLLLARYCKNETAWSDLVPSASRSAIHCSIHSRSHGYSNPY